MPDGTELSVTTPTKPPSDTAVHPAPPADSAVELVISMPHDGRAPARPEADVFNTDNTSAQDNPLAGAEFAPQQNANRTPKRGLLVITAIFVLLLAGAGVSYALSDHTRLASRDTKAASSTNLKLQHDLSMLSSLVGSISPTPSNTSLDSQSTDLHAAWKDAKAQYQALGASPVLHSPTLHTRYKAVQAKWPAYRTFMDQELTDSTAMAPIVSQVDSKLDSLNGNPPQNDAQLATFLTTYKQTTDDANTQLGTLHLQLAQNQQSVSTLRTFLHTVSGQLTTAQTDLAAGNTTAVSTDLLQIQVASATLTKSNTATTKMLTSKLSAIDPSQQVVDFQKSLSSLTGLK